MDVFHVLSNNFKTNMYLVYDKDVGFLIDPAERDQVLEKYIEDNNIEIKFILLTHGHYDHIYSADYYRNKYGVKIYGGIEEKEIFNDSKLNLSNHLNIPVSIDPDIYLNDGDIFSEFEIKAIHTPGHTKGSYSYIVDDYIFSGDTLFYMSIGRSDFPSGNYSELIDSVVNKLFIYKDKIVYPGHDRKTDIDYERSHNPFFN